MIKQTLATQTMLPADVHPLPRNPAESNEQWLPRAYQDLVLGDGSQWSLVVLAGGKDVASFRLRVAQSHLRGDMLPSYWSDCALLNVNQGDFSTASFFNLPLFQPAHASYAPTRNGLIELPLAQLPSQKDFPNLALLAIPVPQEKILASLADYQKARVSYDAVENILPWLAFVWGAGNAANPLMQNIGFPSAMMLNQLFSANGFDLAPGVNANLSAPETFWSGVKHWQAFYSNTQENGLLPKARFVIDHMYDIDEH
ncbi:hypothetical protein [Cellvibrio fontiphilus]|uniref:Uncharacterized protein n=1 Tax=Cellvibrio fontiphilus TaxID=1815559 RepID=A0ABV7FIJ2_9GAMM